MNAQQVFDKVATHLLTQKRKASSTPAGGGATACLYRGPNGLKCAVGCLIPDDAYEEAFEYKTANELPEALWEKLGIDMPIHMNLVMELQTIHDNTAPGLWRERLRALAENQHLDNTVTEAL